jgi:trehalose synthase
VKITDTSDLWWKSAVVYCLDVHTFMDWNGDGRGDFVGLAHRIDYLAELGVTCLWLPPFYPSPLRDDGYDVADFYGIDERLGHAGDFVEVVRIARDRGMRIIIDLVINHTSEQHPWFREARGDKDSPYRDYYIWADKPPAAKQQNVFPGQEKGVWTYEKSTRQYYRHHFYRQQPDLNVDHPLVRDEIAKVMGYWLQLGVSGFRVDAVPFFTGTAVDGREHARRHDYLRSLRAFASRRSGDVVLLGEVNLPRAKQMTFFGSEHGDELNMQFDFLGMQKLWLSLARADARPFAKALSERPTEPDIQWGNFVRNHDELVLDLLTDAERRDVLRQFGPEPEMQAYGRGITRRAPTMLAGDPRRIRMIYSLLFSTPGTPILYYGEEIGMGENLELDERLPVRTPMQWSAELNGGFSRAEPGSLVRPMVTGGFGPEHVSVDAQRHDHTSLLSFIQLLCHRHRSIFEIGWGSLEILEQPNPAVLAHALTRDEGSVLFLHNFGAEPTTVDLDLERFGGGPLTDILDVGAGRVSETGTAAVALEGYGFRWLRIHARESSGEDLF